MRNKMVKSKAVQRWESLIQGIIWKLEGQGVDITSGTTDEGDFWYSANDTHLSIGQEQGTITVFNQWEWQAAFPSLEVCHSIMVGDHSNPVN